jgi:starch phosphorylase
VHAVTNGVHPGTWAGPEFRALFDAHIPCWRHEPELLVQADRIPLEAIARAHAEARQRLLAHVASVAPGAGLEPGRCTIGFARRMTQYKRAHLLFTDPARLAALARRHPLQVVVAGKAHPRDHEGQAQIRQLHARARELAGEVPVVFLPDYGMELASLLVAGVDVWLNTPQRPLEASGTSGMKAALNGVPSLSVLDGWWLEGWAEGETGWAIGEDGPHDDAADAAALYDKLEHTVLPLYHGQPDLWSGLMRRVVARNASFFHSHRMLRRYVLEAYAR